MNKLEQLRKMTTVVADTGDIDSMKAYTPQDATTNPSLLLKAAQQPQYKHLLEDALGYANTHADNEQHQTELLLDKIAVNFGKEILQIVPGRVSSEVDARLSFDTNATVQRAQQLMELYKEAGIDRERILIKIASTWEGIRAASILENQGIHCNLTLMFNIAQAVASAEAGATLISPFVGRILDWYKKAEGVDGYPPEKDPGVISVTNIYHYFKKHGYQTVVMGASFRNVDEIEQLAGCDLLTIAPALMEQLQADQGELSQKLDANAVQSMDIDTINVGEADFRWQMNADPMATEKLAEGIRGFTKDTLKLQDFVMQQIKGSRAA